jgi:two-component system, chemotaxis family, CheB/CheR fusion protein
VETELGAHAPEGDERIAIAGPPVILHEKAAETLALAIHELATNAVKYGALAKSGGMLDVQWAIRNGPVVLEWRETGIGPTPSKAGRGYGRELIEVALPFALGARTRFDLSEAGVYCCIELPEHEWRTQ